MAMDIPDAWAHSAARIIEHRWRVILVIGGADRGKSTYCRFLIEKLRATGANVALVDADVGQKDLGPPATLTLGYPHAVPEGQLLSPAAWYFVGALTPSGHLLPMVLGAQQLVSMARAPYVIVNTTGFIHKLGRVLKSYKIDAIQPDVIVALEQGRELTDLLRAYRHYRTLRLPPSAQATTKTPAQRKAARERAFAAYFASARHVVLPWHSLIIQRSLLLTGTRLRHETFPYLARTSEGLIAVAHPGAVAQPGVTVLPAGCERHLLCGVATRRGHGLGLAILAHIDFAQETLEIITPVPAERIKMLQCGEIYIHPDGRELGGTVPRYF